MTGAPAHRTERTRGRVFLALVLCALACAHAYAQVEPYYNVTAVTSEQISNAVRVTIETDGTINGNIERWWRSSSADGNYYLNWDIVDKQTSGVWSADCYNKVDTIRVHLENARPQVGSVVAVDKYPVSHVKLVTAPDSNGGFGLDLEVVLYKPMYIRYIQIGDFDMWDAYLIDHKDINSFSVRESADSRSLIVTVPCDRIPEKQEHRTLADVPESERKLEVRFNNGLLDVSAQNAALSELVDRVAKASGRQMVVDPAAERVVVAELPAVSVDDFAEAVAQSYGLAVGEEQGCLVFYDPSGSSPATQRFAKTERVPVRNIPATKAIDMLPPCLLGLLRVDAGSNALTVSGPKWLADKVRADIEKIDQPPAQVKLEALVLESKAGSDLLSDVDLDYANKGVNLATVASEGQLLYSKLETSAKQFEAQIEALRSAQRTKVLGRPSVVVNSGETGELFVGVDKYVIIQRTVWNVDQSIEPVSAGVRLRVSPKASSGMVLMDVTTEVKEVGEIDGLTQMPVVNSRSAHGMIELMPGQTLVVGGLTQRQHSRAVRKIPILGDLPLVGALFRKHVTTVSDSSLLVLLTPSIQQPQAIASAPDRHSRGSDE